MSVYIGVDGCKAGWFAVILRDGGEPQFNVYPTLSKLWAEFQPERPAIILIDVPIGLPEEGTRAADLEAQRVLGERRSTLFAVPTRAALYASAYAEGSQINRLITGKMFSKQLWNIAPKIREVDALLRADTEARATFKETHPEILFWGFTGRAMRYPKKTNAGFKERIALLETYLPGAADLVNRAMAVAKRQDYLRDDVVDALAAAVAGRLGNFATLPSTSEYDARGLPMHIVYALRPGITRLHHAQITIPSDGEALARDFYLGLLGLPEIPKPDVLKDRGGFWVAVGDQEVHVSLEDSITRDASTLDSIERATLKAHLAYQVGDLGYWRQRLTENGIAIGESVSIAGYQRFEFRDPFGNRVEFIQPIVTRNQ